MCRALLQQALARSAGDTDAVALLPLALPLAVTAHTAAAAAAADTEEADSVAAAVAAAESVAAAVRDQVQWHEQQLATGWQLATERLHR